MTAEDPAVSSVNLGAESSVFGQPEMELAKVQITELNEASRHERLPCGYCSKTFAKSKGLNVHLSMIHHKKAPAQHLCPHCGDAFAGSSSLGNHIRSIHDGVRYECEQCSKEFTRNYGLKAHIKSAHKLDVKQELDGAVDELTDPVDECTGQDLGYTNMVTNVFDVALRPNGKFSCYLCDKVFDHDYDVSAHIRDDHLTAVNPVGFDPNRPFDRNNVVPTHNSSRMQVTPEFMLKLQGQNQRVEKGYWGKEIRYRIDKMGQGLDPIENEFGPVDVSLLLKLLLNELAPYSKTTNR